MRANLQLLGNVGTHFIPWLQAPAIGADRCRCQCFDMHAHRNKFATRTPEYQCSLLVDGIAA